MNTANISVNTQSSIRIGGSAVLYFDPFQIAEETHDADIIFVTHAHYDHFDPDSIRRIMKEDTVFVSPAGMEKEMRKAAGDCRLVLMKPGDEQNIGGIQVQAVPAYNRLKPFHPKRNGWTGYVVLMDGVRYYVSGDTDAVRELSSVKCDVALVPVGGTYTMTAKEAAKLINEIRPQAAIPTHYGSIVGKPEDGDVFRKYVDPGITVETRL